MHTVDSICMTPCEQCAKRAAEHMFANQMAAADENNVILSDTQIARIRAELGI